MTRGPTLWEDLNSEILCHLQMPTTWNHINDQMCPFVSDLYPCFSLSCWCLAYRFNNKFNKRWLYVRFFNHPSYCCAYIFCSALSTVLHFVLVNVTYLPSVGLVWYIFGYATLVIQSILVCTFLIHSVCCVVTCLLVLSKEWGNDP